MPVYKASDVAPDGALAFSAYGYYSCPKGGEVNVEQHFHDADEYWFICQGRVRVMTEGQEFEVGPGDCVYTAMGDEHDVLEVYEDSAWFWLEGELRGWKRPGHLHRPDDA
jgi:mannose-6-phosphate isomerase-like protein (cupin superfamily)